MSNEGIGVRGSVSVYGIGVGDREIGRTGPSPGIPRENGENGAIAGYPPRLAQTIVINIVNPFKIFGTPLRPNIFFKIYENFPLKTHYSTEAQEIGVKDPVTPNLIAHNHNSLMLQQVTTSQGSSARGGDIRTPYLQPTHLKPPIGARSPQKAPSLAPASWPEVPGGSGRNRTLNLVSSSST